VCGAPEQGGDLAALADRGVEVAAQTVVQGTVTRGGEPVRGAYVRLLDANGDFTAEVVTSAAGAFRFFAAPGDWTLRALAPGASADARVGAIRGGVARAEILLPA